MALTVTLVTPALVQRVSDAYPTMVARFDPAFKCAARGDGLPTIEWLVACVTETPTLREVGIVMDGPTPAGIVVSQLDDSRIQWLVVNRDYDYAEVVTAAAGWVKSRLGSVWGVVDNPATVAAFARSANVKAEGGRLDWVD